MIKKEEATPCMMLNVRVDYRLVDL